ncbi:MAG: hypothetical protein JW874_15770 [Spirochaetales bacterium]|nr:hypothetical protein [Spirochaetales bacterium]
MMQRIKRLIRIMIKYIAYRVFAVLRIIKRIPAVSCSYRLTKVRYGQSETFFGYYDKFPENRDGVIVFHAAAKTSIHPSKITEIDIVIRSGEGEKVLQTRAFNWQQGSRLQWINDSEIVFNDYSHETDNYVCRRYDIKNGSERVYMFPVQDTFHDEFYISIDYHLLSLYASDYGYFRRRNGLSDSAVCTVDFKTGEKTDICTAENALELLGLGENSVFHYYFNHVMISPNGKKIIFMFRYSDGNKYRNDTLLAHDFHEARTCVLARDSMVSHCCWISDREIMAYMEKNGCKSYFRIDTGTLDVQTMFGSGRFRDGHPTYKAGTCISDTYPDRTMIQKLLKIDESGNSEVLAAVYHPPKYYGVSRCDLHPRVNGKTVYFDSVADGKRCLYRMNYE